MFLIFLIVTIAYYTVLPIGETGSGKSLLGCKFINDENGFIFDDSADSVTISTEARGNIINGTEVYYIDNTGFFTTQGKDKSYIEYMVHYLKKWEKGINSFFITINSQNNRFDTKLQMMLKLVYYFFNNPKLWTQAAIVFTKCYEGKYNKTKLETEYKNCVVNYIKTFPGCEYLTLDMKCFFVDSEEYEHNQNMRQEFNRMRNFAQQFKPVSTANLRAINPKYMMKEKKEIKKQLMKIENQTIDNNKKIKRTFYYEDQIQSKIIDWDGKQSIKPPKKIRGWSEWQIEEEEYLLNQLINTKYQGQGKEEEKHEYFEDRKRLKITSQDGTIKYGPIEIISSKTKVTKATVRYESSTKKVNEVVEYFYKKKAKCDKPCQIIFGIATLGTSELFMYKDVLDYIKIIRTYQDIQREIIRSPNGIESFGEWINIGQEYKKYETKYY